MAFKNIARQTIHPGQLVRWEVPGLAPVEGGERPAFLVEHYGPQNSTLIGQIVLNAGQPPLQEETMALVAPPNDEVEALAQWEAQWTRMRTTLSRYCIRGLEGFYHDDENGQPDLERPAGPADVPAILEAVPLTVLPAVFSFCVDEKNFKVPNATRASVSELAKK